MANPKLGLAGLLVGAMTLSACSDGQFPELFGNRTADASRNAPLTDVEIRAEDTMTQDVEAPEVFSVAEAGLWDGRPSLGGVWVAHPDVTDPERVLIKNETTGQTVVGALFRRERDNPGPRIQVSSDAAEALTLLAGQPTELSIVALRQEEIAAPLAPIEGETGAPLDARGEIAATALPTGAEGEVDPIAAAAAAIAEAEGNSVPAVLPAPTAEEQQAASIEPLAPVQPVEQAQPVSSLEKPFIQIGIFNVQDNAVNTAISMREAGILPTVLQGESSGKQFWRVIVGPAVDAEERATLLASIKGKGFEDAYFVTN